MEASVYEQFADLQRSHFWFRGRRSIFFDLIDQALDGKQDLDVLEIGCGPGAMLEPLRRYGRVHALDIDPGSMLHCQNHGFDRCTVGSGTELPFADHSFDFVALFDTIEHIPDDEAVLREVKRILKPGGQVFVSVPAYQFLYSHQDRLVHHQRRYTKGRLRKVLKAAGFEPRKLTYFNALLFPLILPAVLVLKLKEKLVGLPDAETNLSYAFPGAVNEVFARFMSSERLLLRHTEFPFGHSLIGLAES